MSIAVLAQAASNLDYFGQSTGITGSESCRLRGEVGALRDVGPVVSDMHKDDLEDDDTFSREQNSDECAWLARSGPFPVGQYHQGWISSEDEHELPDSTWPTLSTPGAQLEERY